MPEGQGESGTPPGVFSPRARLLAAGACAWALTACAVVLRSLPLPFDRHFEEVLYLMWSGNYHWQPLVEAVFAGLVALGMVDASILLYAGVTWNRPLAPPIRTIIDRAYRYSLALPLFAVMSMNLGRIVANALYALAPVVFWDLTPYLSALEASAILSFQNAIASEWMSRAASIVYSLAWVILVTGFGPALVLADRKAAVDQTLVASLLLSVFALPVFLLVPVFDPWSLNPVYGHDGNAGVGVRYLYPDPNPQRLHYIVTDLRWSTGACLPSLHVGFPLLFALIARRHRLVMLWRVCLGFTGVTALAIVYLGRHWIIDIPVTVPFCYLVLWCTDRLRWQVTRELPGSQADA